LPVRALLRVMLGRYLALKVANSGVVVMTPARLVKDVSTAAYPVRDIVERLPPVTTTPLPIVGAAGPQPPCVPLSDESRRIAEEVASLVRGSPDNLVAPWRFEGGAGDIRYVGGALLVTQTARGHERVAELLDLLRRALVAPAGAVVAVPEPEGLAETRRRLDAQVDLDFENTSLDNILKYLCEVQSGLNIVIDRELQESGVDLSTRVVDLKVKRVALAYVLSLIIGGDLGYQVEPGYVWVTTRDRLASESLTLHVYAVKDILQSIHGFNARIAGAGAPVADAAWGWATQGGELVGRVIKAEGLSTCAGSAPWSDEGGPVVCRCIGGTMAVWQTRRGHERVAAIVTLLRQAFALRDAGLDNAARPAQVMVAGEPVSPEETETLRRLETPVDLDLDKTSLDNCLKFISEISRGLNIVIDPEVAGAGIDLSVRTKSIVGRMTVEAAIVRLLDADLAYRPMTGYVLITTRERAAHLLPLVAYPVADIVAAAVRKNPPPVDSSPGLFGGTPQQAAAGQATDQLLQALRRAVNVQSDARVAGWREEDGAAVAEDFAGVLIVTQTRRGHEKVAEFLTQLRGEQQAAQK